MTRDCLWWIRCAVVLAIAGHGGCSSESAPSKGAGGSATADGYPAPLDLPAGDELPDPFIMFSDGTQIDTVADWESRRRPELIDLFRHYVYGYAPEQAPAVAVTEVAAFDDFFDGAAHYRELEVRFGDAPPTTLSLFYPSGATTPPPVFLALNKCGNHTITFDERVTVSTAWSADVCGTTPANRGIRADSWPIEEIVARGYAVATVHESDFDPDDPLEPRQDGVHPHFVVDHPPEVQWGTIAAWSFGLSRMVDALETRSDVDFTRIATVGHSRRGKAALLTAALDERIAMALPHQSGTVGVTLSRSYNGESVFSITTIFGHWFNVLFRDFANNEPHLPIDQHLLVALVAPRPLMATDGDADDWADPTGARLSIEAAAPVWTLYGSDGLLLDGATPSLDGPLSHQVRPGEHALLASDWELFMDFADRHL